jgi:hypothetical protein
MGEMLRSAYAKKKVKTAMSHLRPKLAHMHQWGVGIPGATEAMVHWRQTVEQLALSGDIPALVAVDVDMVNMFGTTVT